MFNRDRFVRGTDIQEIFGQLGVEEATHAFYLGKELMKAKLAITLGKTYRQEGSLQWGYLTPPDDVRSEHVKLTQRSTRREDAAVTLLVERLDPVPDPADAAVRLSHLPWLIWLDSAVGPEAPGPLEHHVGPSVEDASGPWRVTEQRNAHERAWSRRWPGDMLQVLEREMAPLQVEPRAGQPPFAGGALGFLGYDWGRVLERRPAARYDDLAMPGAMFGLYDWALVWDHEAAACWLVSTGLPATGDERARVAERAHRSGTGTASRA